MQTQNVNNKKKLLIVIDKISKHLLKSPQIVAINLEIFSCIWKSSRDNELTF